MSEEQSLRALRLEKLAKLRELGFDPYAVERFDTPHTASELLKRYDELAPTEEATDDEKASKTISFAGRLVSMRLMGKAAFAHLSDGDDKIQGYFKRDDLPEGQWEAFKLLDIGDHVGVTGYLFTTRTGEKSLHVTSLTPLSKSLHVLPLGKQAEDEEGNVKSWYGLADVDQRYRHRHLDLVCNPDVRKQLIDRSRIVRAVRNFFDSRGYFEVETPMLQLEAGGAAARPFLTHYNAYEMDVKLRISLELYLKRIICGDVKKVYELGRVFRNEGVSNRHNPEFTMLEWYEAYANLEDIMTLVEDLFRSVVQEVYGTDSRDLSTEKAFKEMFSEGALKPSFPTEHVGRFGPFSIDRVSKNSGPGEFTNYTDSVHRFEFRDKYLSLRSNSYSIYTPDSATYQFVDIKEKGSLGNMEFSITLEPGVYCISSILGRGVSYFPKPPLDFSKPWKRLNLLDGIHQYAGIKPDELRDLDSARKAMARVGLPTENENNLGGIIEKLLEKFVEPTLIEPTFVVGYPVETSPLAKHDPERPGFTRRFEGYVMGREICNAFSEINDPLDQRERFEQQIAERLAGDDEAHPMDEDFIYALESGMPPTGGCGIGIDRLVMLLTGSEHLREILMFPMMKPTLDQQKATESDSE